MSRIAFLASFLAAFITMDAQFFDGTTTRQVWRDAIDLSHAAEVQIMRWTHSVRR